MKQLKKINLYILLFVLIPMGVFANESAETFSRTFQTKDYGTTFATGYVESENTVKFMSNTQHVSFSSRALTVPGSYSLKGKAGPVEDQGQCGSCWDFALTETLRGSWITNGKDPGRLSFNYLLNCAKEMQGCSGGDFGAASYFVLPKGAPAYGSDGSYNAWQGKCQDKPAVASTTSFKLLGTDFGAFPNALTPSFQDIAYVVGVLHQPVSVDITVLDSFQKYSGGTYNDCSDSNPKDMNHMVVVEGYTCDKSVDKAGNCVFDDKGNLPAGVGKWIIKNSWGSGWGSSGYITIKATDSKGRKCDSVGTDALFYDLTTK